LEPKYVDKTRFSPCAFRPLVPFLLAPLFFTLTFIVAAHAQTGGGPPPTPVIVAPVVEKEVSPKVVLVGAARPNRESKVAAEAGGRVKAVHFTEGQKVEKGALLVELDKTNEQLRLKAAQARLQGVRVRLREAKRNLARSSSLLSNRSISIKAHEENLFNVRNLEHGVTEAQAELSRLKDAIDRMDVPAPFTGYVAEQYTEVGQWLNPGSPVAAVMELSPIKVQGMLPERYLTEIQVGDRAEVVFDALPAEPFEGRVAAIIPSADLESRSLPVEIRLENKNGRVKAGLLARMTLTGRPRTAKLIPKDALVLDRGENTAFKVRDDQVFPVSVQAGLAYGSDVAVTGGLSAGDLVVVEGNERLRPRQKVRVVGRRPVEDAAEGAEAAAQ
jgi:membrane fusion protein (multidrug efflux system)